MDIQNQHIIIDFINGIKTVNNTNMRYFLLIFILLMKISCNNIHKTSEFEQKIDSLKQIIPTISGNHTFSFAEISENVWEWQNSQKFIEIDSILWVDYFDKPQRLISYKYDYQTNYYYKIIDLQDNFFNFIILQHIHNNNESYMYLIQFDKQGNRQKAMVFASISKSPVDYKEVYSSIEGNKIATYEYYEDEDKILRNTTFVNW